MAMEPNSQRYNPRQRTHELETVGYRGRNYCDGDDDDDDDGHHHQHSQYHDAADSEEDLPSYRPELSNGYCQDEHARENNFINDASFSQGEPWDGGYAGKDGNSNFYSSSNYNANTNDIDLCEQQFHEHTIGQRDDLGRKFYETNLNDLYHTATDSYSDDEQSLNDNNIRDEEDMIERSKWAFSDTDIHQLRCPQTIDFDQHEDHYYKDDQHQHVVDDNNLPIREVTFNHREQYVAYSEHHDNQSFVDENKFEHTQNDYESYDEESRYYDEYDDHSVDESSICSDTTYAGRHRSDIKSSSAEANVQSSDSLDVIQRIESVMETIIMCLDRKEEPILRGYVNPQPYDNETHEFFDSTTNDAIEAADIHYDAKSNNGDPKFHRNFGNIAQSRSFASICLVMSFIHQLLLSNRTTTTREVFYVFVTHFRNQRECDAVILDVAKVLGVSRRSLGLFASPKGWFCGCVEITRRGTLPSGKDVSGTIDGTALFSIQGLPITKEWTERDENGCTSDGVEVQVFSKDAKVILVIEKEGVYNRLSEERIFDRFPCILVTGKGFPDLATRALVSALHRELQIPVAGICDCNPFGISVLALYHCAGDRMGVDGRRRYTVPIEWLGLRPSKVARLKNRLPETVFQKLTDLDNKRIASLLDNPDDPYLTKEDEVEVRDMKDAGYKVELEALYWIGPDFMGDWVVNMLKDKYGSK